MNALCTLQNKFANRWANKFSVISQWNSPIFSSLHANSTVAFVYTPHFSFDVARDVTQTHTRQIVACYQSAKENRGVECDAAEPFFTLLEEIELEFESRDSELPFSPLKGRQV